MRAILIDDEPLALDLLESRIKKISNIDIAGKFTNFSPTQEAPLLKEIEVVFLDVEMPGMNGIEMAEKMLEFNPKLTIIFVTAYREYAADAFDLNALDYLLKPVQLDRLQKTLDRIEQNLQRLQAMQLEKNRTLKVSVCNELTFHSPDGKTEIISWRTAKAQELFLYLLQNRSETIRKSKLIDVLWSEVDEQKGYSQLYTTVYHIRKALQPFGNHFSLSNVLEGYILNTENTLVDLEQWEMQLTALPPISKETVATYEDTMDLYKGPYLAGSSYLWAESERLRLEQLWLKYAYDLANYYYEHANLEKAEKWFVAISKRQPEDETAGFSLMKIYQSLGLGMLVSHHYNLLHQSLSELDLKISPGITKWYEAWNQNKLHS